MLDISRISTIDIKTLSEDETDSWCLKVLKLNVNDSEVDKSDVLALFQFTRSLLNVKHIQTDVLLEELQNVEQKYEDVQNELDTYKQKVDEQSKQSERLNELEKELREAIQQRHELTMELEQKDRELMRLRSQITNSPDSGLDSDRSWDELKIKLKEKNEQIEQLLDRLYDSDRINLDLAEQVAKLRVDLSKSENDNRLLEARCQMLEGQIKELESLNENLMKDREKRVEELNRLRDELEKTSGKFIEKDGSTEKIDLYQQMAKEIERLNALLVVKDSEILELREMIHNVNDQQRNIETLSKRNDQIELLEEELSILSEGLTRKVKNSEEEDDEGDDEINQIQYRKLNRRIRKLKKQVQALQLKNEELEEEARRKDEELARQRKRMSMLIGGDDRVKKLLEENSVLNRMVRSRDNRIEFLINQLNKHQLVPEGYSDSSNMDKGLCIQQEMELRDQLIAITVERDVLQRQVDVIKSHLESVHNENLELQMGMKEILDSIRQSEANTDLVLECPSLERVCRLLENRFIYFGLDGTDDTVGANGANLTQVILLKSELDHVRGQNEQLRNELKILRADFLSVIDEYTTDILDNWTISASGGGGGSTSLSDSKTEDIEDEGLISSEDSKPSETESVTDQKSTEGGTKPRPRSRSRRRISRDKPTKRLARPPTRAIPIPDIETIDVGLDPIQEWPSSNNDEKESETKEPQTTFVDKAVQTEDLIESEVIQPRTTEQPSQQQLPQNPEIVHLAADADNKEEEDDDLYVLMQNASIQAVPDFDFQSTQTEEKFDEKPETETKSECLQCAKHLSMLDSVRKLMDKERQHFRQQGTKQSELVKSLKQNLQLVKKEYQLDIAAKNEELQDLRNKMMQLTNSMDKLGRSVSLKQDDQQVSGSLIMVATNNDDNDLDGDFAKMAQPKLQSQQSMVHKSADGDVSLQSNKVILETIIDCLQKCLKQKDEALEEYRKMMEQMRDTYRQNLATTKLNNDKLNGSKFPGTDNKNLIDADDNGDLRLEKIYEDLFVKPKVQENDQLMELLRSTIHQLESVRTKSRERIKQLETELDAKSLLIIELEAKNERLTQQVNSDKAQIQKLESQSKIQEEKIQTLTNKLNDMIRRNQQSVQTASALKKKVENSIFQESADLRSKITELGAEVRRLEVEKWNIEKRLAQERQSIREKLVERDQTINQLTEQVAKLQALVAKMEKKVLVKKQPQQSKSATTKDQSTWTMIETRNRSTQTAANIIIIDNETKSSNGLVRSNKNQDDIKMTKSKEDKSKYQEQEIPIIEIDNTSIDIMPDLHRKISEEEIQNPVDYEQAEVGGIPETEVEELDSSRQIIIDTLRLEQMSTIMNEIAIVGNEMMKTPMNTTPISTGTINQSNNNKSTFQNDHQTPLETLKSSSCSSRDTGSICPECESKFNAHRIEQHLIDLRLERLLDENIRLKLELGSSRRKLTK